MPSYNTIQFALDGGIAEITLNRPEALNAFNDEMAAELQDALKNAERDASVRALLLTGAGKGFCAGQDLNAVRERPAGHSFRDHLLKTFNPIVAKLTSIEKPVIAAINGAAVGAGFGIALACDIRYASESARFRTAFIGIGLAPDSGTSYFLPRLLGMGRALELAYTNELVDAASALQLGLVNKVFPAADLLTQARALAAQLAAGPTRGYGLTKRAMRHTAANVEDALDYEAHLQDIAGRTHDHTEGVNAFLEKRKPGFKGANMVTIGIVGGGTMGSGIAQVCAMRGFSTILYDVSEEMVARATANIHRSMNKALELGKTSPLTVENARINLNTTIELDSLSSCSMVIEAVPETLEIKRELFSKLDRILASDAILASNTSSLSITAIAAGSSHPENVVGLHFFNPAHLMNLVEVVKGDLTLDAVAESAMEFVRALNKTPVLCKDTPAFIVNRVARPFYGEALRLLGENTGELANNKTEAEAVAAIDTLMKSLGFRMGPFELMDMIGLDVNFAVTQSVYNAFFQEPKYRPSPIQQKMVESGRLGRKTKKGFYEYPS